MTFGEYLDAVVIRIQRSTQLRAMFALLALADVIALGILISASLAGPSPRGGPQGLFWSGSAPYYAASVDGMSVPISLNLYQDRGSRWVAALAQDIPNVEMSEAAFNKQPIIDPKYAAMDRVGAWLTCRFTVPSGSQPIENSSRSLQNDGTNPDHTETFWSDHRCLQIATPKTQGPGSAGLWMPFTIPSTILRTAGSDEWALRFGVGDASLTAGPDGGGWSGPNGYTINYSVHPSTWAMTAFPPASDQIQINTPDGLIASRREMASGPFGETPTEIYVALSDPSAQQHRTIYISILSFVLPFVGGLAFTGSTDGDRTTRPTLRTARRVVPSVQTKRTRRRKPRRKR